MHRRSNYKQEMSEIIRLREAGYKTGKIAEITGIPRGTITARLSRMKANVTSHNVEVQEIKPVAVPQKEKTLMTFSQGT